MLPLMKEVELCVYLSKKRAMHFRLRLTKPATGRRLTLAGWFLVLAVVGLLIYGWATSVLSYLSPNQPLEGAKILMVEGFLPDYALEEASDIFVRDDYNLLVTTGQTILAQGTYLSEYQSLAAIAYATLEKIGMDTNLMVSAPAPATWRDRSVANARAGFEKLRAMGVEPCKVNVMSLSAHSRRSWLIFNKVGREYGFQTGIISKVDSTFDEEAWWKSSRGMRVVIAESLACYYVELFGLSD
jgi:hypothetical protein